MKGYEGLRFLKWFSHFGDDSPTLNHLKGEISHIKSPKKQQKQSISDVSTQILTPRIHTNITCPRLIQHPNISSTYLFTTFKDSRQDATICATEKTVVTFHFTGCLIGILIMVYYNPLMTV